MESVPKAGPAGPEEQGLTSPVWWPFWIAFGVALALRLLWPEIRPLHHDEGVNGWFLVRLLDGYRYEYDPERFHGPFLYFFGAPFAVLLGMSETVLRLPVMLASSAMIPLLLPLRRWMGRTGSTGATAAAWLLAVSPSLVSYGRDLIHETYLVALTLALVAAVSLWLETGRDRDLVLAALSLSLMFTVKETAVLTLAGLAAGAVAAWWAAGRPPVLERLRADPLRTRRLVVIAGVALVVPYVLLFTSFLTNPWGLVDSVRAFLPWTEKGIEGSGHEKPWPYFFRLLGTFEPAALAGGVLGSVVALRLRNPFGVFCAVWWVGQIAAYSVIPYKTPWLVLNMVLPLTLAVGALFGELGRRPLAGPVRAALAGIGLLLVAWTAAKAIQVSFLRYDDERLGLVYVQTTREVRELMAMIEDAAARSPEGKRIAIRFYTNNRWPLPWYLREYRGTLYLKEVPYDPGGDVLIFEPGQEPDVRAGLKDWKRYQRRVFTLRKNVKLVVYVRPRDSGMLESAGSTRAVPP
jgi:uncharacterized protein (TIGR03663 family)